jgi:hypothetical protein
MGPTRPAHTALGGMRSAVSLRPGRSIGIALLAGAPLFTPPASGGIWAAAHQCRFLQFFIFFLFFVIISEGFFWFCFYWFSGIYFFLLVFSVLLGDFKIFNFKIIQLLKKLKFEFRSNTKFVHVLNSEQIQNLFISQIYSNSKKIQNSNLFKTKICSKSKFVQIWISFKYEICSCFEFWTNL